MTKWQNRTIGSETVDADQLLANERNPRIHPLAQQQALTDALTGIGWLQDVIVNKRTAEEWGRDRGIETVLDGHLRVALAISAGETVPVKYVDLTPQEEILALSTFDAIGAMAGYDAAILNDLLKDVQTDSVALDKMLAELAVRQGVYEPDDPRAEWVGMPEFEQEDKEAYKKVVVHFEDENDYQAFFKLIGQAPNAKAIWFPAQANVRIGTVKDES